MKFLKKGIYFIGKTLGFLGLIFVIYKLSQEYTLDMFLEKISSLKSIIFSLIILNFISLSLGIYAWYIMLLHYSKKNFSYLLGYYYFAKTEIAKYLPGNIFHFVGRQLLAKEIGIKQKDMAKISLLFSLLLLFATIVSGTIFSFFSITKYSYIMLTLYFIFFVSLVLNIVLYSSFPIIKKLKLNLVLGLSVTLQGLMLGIIVFAQIEDISITFFFQLIAIYIFSWMLGFVTPGASGGIGVREGAFISISEYMHIAINSDVIVFSILLVRFINILTDMLAYGSTYLLEKKFFK